MNKLKSLLKTNIIITTCFLYSLSYGDGFPKLHPESSTQEHSANKIYNKNIINKNIINKKKPIIKNSNNNKTILLNRIVAIVNKQTITQEELDKAVKTTKMMLQQQNISIPDHIHLEKQVLNQMILERLQLQLAQKNGITASQEDYDNAFKQIAAQNKMPVEQLKPIIEKQYGSQEEYKKTLKKQIIINKLQQQVIASQNIQVNDRSVQNLIAKQKHMQKQYEQYKVEHILIPLPVNPSPKDIKDTKAKAEDILEKIKKGMDFKQAAATYSSSEDALKGGILPWKTLPELPDSFQSVSKMKAGEVSGLIRSPGGFNIIKLVDKKEQQQNKIIINNYKIKQITIKTTPIITNYDAKERLERIRNSLIHGGSTFSEMAKSNSDDHDSSINGGDLPWMNANKIMATNPKMAEIIKDLKIDQISKPFEYNNTWYLIKLVEKKKVDSTEEVEKQHAQQIIFQKQAQIHMENWASELRGNSYVKILVPDLK